MTQAERQKLTEWLEWLGESDPELIADFWRQVETEPDAKTYFLARHKKSGTIY